MHATLKDIVKRVGVSTTAISLYLNKDPRSRLSEETRARIDAAVRELDYRPSVSARALRKGRSGLLGLVTGPLTDPFDAHLIEFCLHYCGRFDYQVLLTPANWNEEKERKALVNLLDRRVDGIIYHPCLTASLDFGDRLAQARVPLLLVNHDAPDFLAVRQDWNTAFGDVAAHFRRRGHRAVEECVLTDRHAHAGRALRAAGLDHKLLSRHRPSVTVDELIDGWLARRPTALFIHDCKISERLLLRALREGVDYRPDIVTIHNLAVDVLEDECVGGVVHGDFYGMLSRALDRFMDDVEEGRPKPAALLAPTRFYTRADFDAARGGLIDSLEKFEAADAAREAVERQG